MHAILFVCCLSTRRSRIGKFMSEGSVADDRPVEPGQVNTIFDRHCASISYWDYVFPVYLLSLLCLCLE